MVQARAIILFALSRYLEDKYFDIVWVCHSHRNTPNGPQKNNVLNGLSQEAIFLSILS